MSNSKGNRNGIQTFKHRVKFSAGGPGLNGGGLEVGTLNYIPDVPTLNLIRLSLKKFLFKIVSKSTKTGRAWIAHSYKRHKLLLGDNGVKSSRLFSR